MSPIEQLPEGAPYLHGHGALPFSIGRRRVQLKELKAVHQEILRRHVAGQQNVDIAKDLSIAPGTVTTTVQSTLGAARIAELEAAADAEIAGVSISIRNAAARAFEKMQELLEADDTSNSLRFAVARDIMDRAGLGAVQKVARIEQKLTTADLEELKRRGREAGIIKTVDMQEEEGVSS